MIISEKLKPYQFLVAILFAVHFQQSQATALIDAVKNGDYELAEALIYSDAPLNEEDDKGDSALIWSIRESANHPQNIKILELLLKKGADLNKQNTAGDTPLITAAQENNLEAIELLLSYKPDLDIENQNLNTALMIADKNAQINAEQRQKTAQKIVTLLFQKMTIQEKSCFLTFEQYDLNFAITKALHRSLLMKIISITPPHMLNKLFDHDPLLREYCKTGKITLLASQLKLTNSIIPQLIIVIPQSLDELGIKIPESEKKKNEPIVDLSLVENKYGLKNVNLVNPQYAADLITTAESIDEYELKKIIENFTNIINSNVPSHLTRFYLIGHGRPGLIAQIPVSQIENFLWGLSEIHAEFLYISSCYAAGINLLTIQSSLTSIITKQIAEKEKTKKIPGIDYAITIKASSDIATSGIGNIKAMFMKLDQFLQKPVWALDFGPGVKKPRITISSVIAAIGFQSTYALPSIRFPGKTQFFRPIKMPFTEIITESRLIEAGVEKTLALIAESKSANKTVADEAKKKLESSLDIKIHIMADIRNIQVLPMDLTDFTFLINGEFGAPVFISKLTGKGQHYVNKIVFEAGNTNIDDLIYDSFFKIAQGQRVYKTDRCWFIREVDLAGKDAKIFKKLAIKLYSKSEGAGALDYAYINEKGEYIIFPQEIPADKQNFETTVRKWFKETIPSQETLTEATGGIEVTATEKARLEKEKGGEQALKLIEPRFARTPEDLFNMFMAY